MAVKVGRSEQAQAAAVAHSGSLAGEARVTDAALDAAGVIRCADLDELLETAELVEGARRTGRRVGRGRTGVVTVSHRRGVAHRRPRAADRARPAADPRRGARPDPRGACRRWATSAIRSTRGAPPTPTTAYGAVLRGDGGVRRVRRARARPRLPVPLAAGRGRDRERGHAASCSAATRDRPGILPVYVSLTSGEPPPETKAAARRRGRRRAAAARRGRGLQGDRRRSRAGSDAAKRRRRTARGGRPGRRSPRIGPRTAPIDARAASSRRRPPSACCRSARASSCLRAAGLRGHRRPWRSRTRTPPSKRRDRRAATRSCSSSTPPASPHKSDLGLRAPRPARRRRRSVPPRERPARRRRGATAPMPAGCSSSRWPTRGSS